MLAKVYLVDAFTETPGKGNRAGVMLGAGHLTEIQMQEIARQVNVSETAFVLPPDDKSHEVKVRYFTPTKEVPICGHATIATHYLRAKTEHIMPPKTVLSKTGVGVLPVDIEKADDGNIKVIMTQGTPSLESPLAQAAVTKIVDALGISLSEIDSSLPVQIASTGHSKVIIPLKSKQVLDQLHPDSEKLKQLSNELGSNGFYTFTLNTGDKDILTAGRMFAPAIGIEEDPVTGNANGPAGYYLYKHNKLNKSDNIISYTALQGEAMGKPGFVEVILRRDPTVDKVIVQVKGSAIEAGKVSFQLDKNKITQI